MIATIYVLFVAFGGMALIWVWHIAAPAQWRWLEDVKLDKLQDVLTGGVIASILVDHFRKRLR